MPYKDPEKARECYRLAQARHRAKRAAEGNPVTPHTSEYMAEYYAANRRTMIDNASRRNAAFTDAGVSRLSTEQIRAQNARRKAIKRNASGTHNARDIQDILQTQNFVCVYCLADLHIGYHVDHMEALSRGGSNGKDNLQMLCPSCNMSKHASDIAEYEKRIGFIRRAA